MKGQRLRIYEEGNERRVQGETSCELHISIETESEVNKDNADQIREKNTLSVCWFEKTNQKL